MTTAIKWAWWMVVEVVVILTSCITEASRVSMKRRMVIVAIDNPRSFQDCLHAQAPHGLPSSSSCKIRGL